MSATSVLGDLMEKCPPAEACRDALERMSKATVQMCMSTPGFGFSAEREDPRQPLSRQTSLQSTHVATSTVPVSHAKMDQYHPLAPKPVTKRPPPKFDMDLRELFPEDMEPSTRPSYSFPQPLGNLQRAQPQQTGFMLPLAQQPQTSPVVPHPSPASSINSQANTALGLGPQQQSNPASNGSFLFPQQQRQQQPFYMQNTYNPDFMSSLPGMDFLNDAVGTGGDDFNFDASGLDLGFGMGLDLQHDWSDGQQFDLFDGFFFGNNGGVGGSGGATGGSGAKADGSWPEDMATDQ